MLGVGALAIRSKVEAYKVDRMAKRDEVIAENQVKAANAEKTVQNAQEANRGIDAQTKAQISQLQVELASKPDSTQIRAIVEASLPGVKTVSATDAMGLPVLAIPDTQETRDAINRAATNAKICNVNLSDCEAKQANFQTIIQSQQTELNADKSTISLQQKDITDLRKNQVPRWTAMLGVGKTQASNFQDPQSYQPFLGLDYRLTSRIGVFGAAQNKSAAAGISWHFGGTK